MSGKIGFIGTGNIGGTLAELAAAAGYNVVVSNRRGPPSLKPLVERLGNKGKEDTIDNVIGDADINIIIVSIPLKAIPSLPADKLKGRILIDTTNYYPERDGQIDFLDNRELTSSGWLQKLVPGASVVKAFNNQNTVQLRLNATKDEAKRTTVPIAGDDDTAKETITKFINSIGYNTYDVGPISDSWKFEPGTPIYGVPYIPEYPKGADEKTLKEFFIKTPGPQLTHLKAKELLDKADKSKKVGGFISDFPKEAICLFKIPMETVPISL